MPLPFYMYRAIDPLCPTFLKPTEIFYPEEIQAREVARKTRRLSRSTPYPICLEGCTVTETWGPGECRAICTGRFDEGQ